MNAEDFQLHVVESLTRLETQMKDLVGNGKPGRITEIERSISNLNKWRWIIAGGALTVSILVHFVFRY